MVVFDEAHNIEDVCRDMGSLEISKQMMLIAVKQVKDLVDSVAIKSLYTLVISLLKWIDEMEAIGEGSGGENVWDGEEALLIFRDRLGLNEESLQVYRQHLADILEQQGDFDGLMDENPEDESADNGQDSNNTSFLSTPILNIFKNLINVFMYLLPNGKDYKVCIENGIFNVWLMRGIYLHCCLKSISAGGVVFQEIDAVTRCVLLTSGTLSP